MNAQAVRSQFRAVASTGAVDARGARLWQEHSAGVALLAPPTAAQNSPQSIIPDVTHSGLSTRVNEGGDPDSFNYTLSGLSSGCRSLEAFAGSGLEIRQATGPAAFLQRVGFWLCGNANTASFEVRAVDDGWDVPGIWRQPGNTGDTYSSRVRIYEVDAGLNGLPRVASVSVPVTIVDNDPPMVNLSGGAAVAEGDAAGFTVTATSPPRSALTVRFPEGSRTGVISIPTVEDSLWDPEGQLTVALRPGTGYVLGKPSEATIGTFDLAHRNPRCET